MVRSWLGRLDELGSRPVDTSHYATLIGFDNMGRIGFSTDFGTVREGREDSMLELLEITFGTAAALGHVYWPVALMMNMPKFGMQKEFEQLGVDMADGRLKVSNPGLFYRRVFLTQTRTIRKTSMTC